MEKLYFVNFNNKDYKDIENLFYSYEQALDYIHKEQKRLSAELLAIDKYQFEFHHKENIVDIYIHKMFLDNNQKNPEQLLNEIFENLKLLKNNYNWMGEFLIEKELECDECGSISENLWIDIDDMIKVFQR